MQTKTVYSYDEDFKYVCKKILDHTDKDPFGYFNIPGNCTEIEPPTSKIGFDIYWTGTAWEYQEIPMPEPEPDPTLEQLKEEKIQEFKYKRDSDELSAITTTKGTFDFDEKSLMRINEAKDQLADSSATIEWTAADNSRVIMTHANLMQIKAAGAQRSNELHIKYNDLKAQINSVLDKKELEQIVW